MFVFLELMDQNVAKWEGKVSARLVKSTVDQIWPLFTDFFNIHKWCPGLETCYGVHGNNGEPGCIRFCKLSATVSYNDVIRPEMHEASGWAKERIIAVDHDEHTLTYQLLENNLGFESYVAKFKIIPASGEDGPRGCTVEWSFTVEPIERWTLDALLGQYDQWLHLTLNKMEASLENFE